MRLYPLRTVGNWYVAQRKKATWFSTFNEFSSCVLNRQKNPFDGFGMSVVISMCNSWLILPPMAVLKYVMNIPDENEMRFYLSYILQLGLENNNNIIKRTHEEKKALLQHAFTQIIKNSVAFSISNYLSSLVLYPLSTVQARLTFQGSELSEKSYSSSLDCFRNIYSTEGISGFYNGFYVRSLMIIPELGMWLVVYAAGSLGIKYLYEG